MLDNGHWTLITYEPESKEMKLYDSMHFKKEFAVDTVDKYLVMESQEVSVLTFIYDRF